MKSLHKLTFFAAAGIVTACSTGSDTEIQAGFTVAGFYLEDGQVERLVPLVADGETLIVVGRDFRVPLAIGPEELAPAIEVLEGDLLDLVAISETGERHVARLLIRNVEQPRGWVSSSVDLPATDIKADDKDETPQACTSGSYQAACTKLCCSGCIGTNRRLNVSYCISGQWVLTNVASGCCPDIYPYCIC